jgi:hypothetical protein
MEASVIERTIEDCGIRARFVGLDRGVIELLMLDDAGEPRRLARFSVSEFCDLALECRARAHETATVELVYSAA